MAFKTLWFWKPSRLNENWEEVHAFSGNDFPKPSVQVHAQKPTTEEPVWHGSLDEAGHLFINWNDPDVVGIAPPAWFAIHDAPSPYPGGPPIPYMFIHAMNGDDYAPGTIVRGDELIKEGHRITAKGIGNSERFGFVQWGRSDSKIQQVFVEEEWRRKRVTLAMFGVADLVIVAGNYGPMLNGGDVTTDDGEKLRQAWLGSTRLIPRSGAVQQ